MASVRCIQMPEFEAQPSPVHAPPEGVLASVAVAPTQTEAEPVTGVGIVFTVNVVVPIQLLNV